MFFFYSNLWSRPNNINIVKTIAKEYQFSTRLLDTILGWDEARRVTRARRERAAQEQAAKARVVPDDATDRMQQKPRRRGRYLQDPEKGVSDGNEANISIKKSIVQKLQFHQEDLDLYELLQDQYNYTTIDHGEKCKYLGKMRNLRRRSNSRLFLQALQLFASGPTGCIIALKVKKRRSMYRTQSTPIKQASHHQSIGLGIFLQVMVSCNDFKWPCRARVT